MNQTKDKRLDQQNSRRRERRLLPRLGIPVASAIICAIASFLIFAGMTPIEPTDGTVSLLFLLDIIAVSISARLHRFRNAAADLSPARKNRRLWPAIRIVALFAVIAAVPTLVWPSLVP